MIEIPPERLDRDTLDGLIEAFVLREGTDYGECEVAFADKIQQVRRQILRREVVIVFDPDTETCNLLDRREFQRLAGESS